MQNTCPVLHVELNDDCVLAYARRKPGIRRKRQAWGQGRCPKLCGLFHIFGEVAKGDEL